MTTLLIDVFNLAKTAAERTGQLPIAQLTRLHSNITNTTGAMTYRISGEPDALLHIEVQGSLNMTCQRCLEPLNQPIDVNNTLHLVVSEAELDSEEDELNAIIAGIDAPEKIIGATDFDICALLEDEIILSLPISVVHDICPTQLPMSSGQKASAFDVLAQLK